MMNPFNKGTRFSLRILSAMACVLLALTTGSPAVAASNKYALVIGNGAYKNSPLKNPVNDANDMARVLRQLGFIVIHKNNQSRKQMRASIRLFGQSLKKGGVGLFYYAGHGVQIKGKNFLLPVDTDIKFEDEIPDESVEADLVLRKMESAGNNLNIVILDSCRNNPFVRSSRSGTRGLARMNAPSGTILAYSTAPGNVAADGKGRNGVYTKHLLAAMRKPGLSIEHVFKQVRIKVELETQGKQTPWEESSLKGDFYFIKPQINVFFPETGDKANVELTFWNSIKDSRHVAEFEQYLKRYPQGEFADLARLRIAKLKQDQQQAAPPPSPRQNMREADLNHWRRIESSRRIADFEGYLSTFPEGIYAARARTRIAELKRKSSSSGKTPFQSLPP